MKTIGHRLWLSPLILITVGLLAGLAWLVWPGPDLTLRLKFVRTEVVDGKTKLLFRVEGAEKYNIFIKGFRYISEGYLPLSDEWLNQNGRKMSDPVYGYMDREFYVDHPQPPSSHPQLFNYEMCKLQAAVCILAAHESKFSRLCYVIKDIWKVRKKLRSTTSAFSLAKTVWQWKSTQMQPISDQVITSELITNTPPH